MRSYFLTSLAVAGLAASAAAHSGGAPMRKSLGFGPVHPQARLRTVPPKSSCHTRSLHAGAFAEPHDVALRFLDAVLRGESDFIIRKDSYTDRLTGVTHVYARQMVGGIEVADGDINMNIKDGKVLSYGDSFYRGPAPSQLAQEVELDPHAQYCSELKAEASAHRQRMSKRYESQITMGSLGDYLEAIEPLGQLASANCDLKSTNMRGNERYTSGSGAAKALLRFMADATPKESVVRDILDNYEDHLTRMTSTFEHNLHGDNMYEIIDNVPDAVSPVKARIAYVQIPDGDKTVLSLVWKFEVEMEDNWYEASVSAYEPHNIVAVVDWASDAMLPVVQTKPVAPTYNVFPWGVNDPAEGNRSIVQEFPDEVASPAGWHALPSENDPSLANVRGKRDKWHNTTTTWGNNVFAHENWEGRSNYIENYRPDGGEKLVFDFPYDPKPTSQADAPEEAKKYINTTITQLFYTSNLVHDLFYRYGFDEVSGNFQQYNFGRGGLGDDAVIANAQDGSGYNNANFMTPPDGQNGRCRMYLWNTATPYRDGDLEAGIVIHELSHGLSTRLTGGPANSGCLGWGESGGMGEGWGDFLATTIRSTKEYSDYPMGEWAANRVGGIRNYVYSLNETINPSTYKTLDKPGYFGVHAIGEVWAEILWVVSQKLITKHGFGKTLFPPVPVDGVLPPNDFYRAQELTAGGAPKPLVPKHGNTLIVQLVLTGMKLQPCRPSFFDARDAIVQADQVLTGGENFCELWQGFSERGLGPDARVDGRTPWGGGIRTNDYDVPLACKEEKVPEDP